MGGRVSETAHCISLERFDRKAEKGCLRDKNDNKNSFVNSRKKKTKSIDDCNSANDLWPSRMNRVPARCSSNEDARLPKLRAQIRSFFFPLSLEEQIICARVVAYPAPLLLRKVKDRSLKKKKEKEKKTVCCRWLDKCCVATAGIQSGARTPVARYKEGPTSFDQF